MSKIIALYNQKGGVGKTMLSRLLAGDFAERDHLVRLIDVDSQQNLAEWAINCRLANKLPKQITTVSALDKAALAKEFEAIKDDEIVIIDLPGKAEKLALQAAASADLVLIPTKPSTDDVKIGLRTAKGIVESMADNQAPPLIRFVFNEIDVTDTNAEVFSGALDMLDEARCQWLDTFVSKRGTYRRMAAGEGTIYTMAAKNVKDKTAIEKGQVPAKNFAGEVLKILYPQAQKIETAAVPVMMDSENG